MLDFLLAVLIGVKLFKLSRNSVILIGAGSSICGAATVMAAGMNISPEVAGVAVITKLVRVMMLAPFLLLLPFFCTTQNGTKKKGFPIPWFAFLFIAMTLVNSGQLLPAQWVNVLVQIDTILLSMAMAALGLTTHFSVVRKAGVKPLLFALVLFGWLMVGGALINRVVF